MPTRERNLAKARELSWQHHGRRIGFYLPGMFAVGATRGRYPALSLTGQACALTCEHCRGMLLRTMLPATDPDTLVEQCRALEAAGNVGVLISGGCDPDGRLPWEAFAPALATVKATTGLLVSVHCGFLDRRDALALKAAGVDQALIDIIGSDDTYRLVYHVEGGGARLEKALAALGEAGLPVVPHIVCGLHYGELRGEARALDMVAELDPDLVVVLSLMNLPGTPMAATPPPSPDDVADVLVAARLRLPRAAMSLGCARPRGQTRLELLALAAGVNRMALPADETRERAAALGLAIAYHRTCCSVARGPTEAPW